MMKTKEENYSRGARNICYNFSSWEMEAAEQLMQLSGSGGGCAELASISSNATAGSINNDDDWNLNKEIMKKTRQEEDSISNSNRYEEYLDGGGRGCSINQEHATSGKIPTTIIIPKAVKEIIRLTEAVKSSVSPPSCSSSCLSLGKRKPEIFEDSDILNDDHSENNVGFTFDQDNVGFTADDNRKNKPKKYRTLVQIYKRTNPISMT